MNVALDFHGVIDHNPSIFIIMAEIIRKQGGKIVVISGSSNKDDVLTKQLLEFNDGVVWWDEIVSVTDSLLEAEEEYVIDKHGRPWFSDDEWNGFKGRYCNKNNIDMLVDDTKDYGLYLDSKNFHLYRGTGMESFDVG